MDPNAAVELAAGQVMENVDFGNWRESAAQIAGRHVFYNRSYFDGDNPAADGGDDGALASDKTALLPGGTAGFANYTSFSRGLNGIMVDIAGLADPDALGAGQFEFRAGNSHDPSTWALAPPPSSVSVRTAAGAGGSDRVTLIWPDGAISNQWLQVTVKAGAVTGLAAPDVFYFGNAIGESGNSTSNAYVDGSDFAAARDNYRGALDRAPIDYRFDYDRDSFVDGNDLAIARDHGTNFVTALRLIAPPAGAATAAPGGLPALVLGEAESVAPPAESRAPVGGESFAVLKRTTFQAAPAAPAAQQLPAERGGQQRPPQAEASGARRVESIRWGAPRGDSRTSALDFVLADLDPLEPILDQITAVAAHL